MQNYAHIALRKIMTEYIKCHNRYVGNTIEIFNQLDDAIKLAQYLPANIPDGLSQIFIFGLSVML